MPSKEWNQNVWNETYPWKQAGDEWSSNWGSAEAQWYGSLYPRFHRYLPAKNILEIGPGHGRWTQFLLHNCSHLDLVDLSTTCINACKKRFQACSNINFHVNDGTSLSMIADHSIDLVFSFDSLVHAEDDVIEGYLKEISKKLTSNGVGIIHHSNLGQYQYFKILRAFERISKIKGSSIHEDTRTNDNGKSIGYMAYLKRLFTQFLISAGLVDRTHMRALSVTAESFRSQLATLGLHCLSQEVIRWGSSTRLIDCITVFTRKHSCFQSSYEMIRNKQFMREAEYIRRLAKLYNT